MSSAIEAVKALATGFATTFKHLFRKPITEQYPEYKRTLPERTRARIILTRDPDGKERCVACYLCSAVCPVSCISMQSAAKADGRWENAYATSEMKVPADFLAALENKPKAKQFFETLNKSSRCAIAYGLTSAKKPDTRQRRFAKFMDMLVREEKPDFGFKKTKKATNG